MLRTLNASTSVELHVHVDLLRSYKIANIQFRHLCSWVYLSWFEFQQYIVKTVKKCFTSQGVEIAW